MAGKRIQIYLPADLVERLERVPRYERSKEVAKALREYWKVSDPTPMRMTHADDSQPDRDAD